MKTMLPIVSALLVGVAALTGCTQRNDQVGAGSAQPNPAASPSTAPSSTTESTTPSDGAAPAPPTGAGQPSDSESSK